MTNQENKTIQFLKNITSKLDLHQYKELKSWLIEYVKNIPIPLLNNKHFQTFHNYNEYQNPTELFRARENETISPNSTMLYPFTTVGDISHVPMDKPHLIKYNGRANLKGQIRFYCSIYRPTACMESLTQGFTKDVSENKTATLGTWKVDQPLVLAQIMFSEQKIKDLSHLQPERYNEQISFAQNWYNNVLTEIESDPSHTCSMDFAKEILEFFSDEFGKMDITSENDYHLSIFYTEYIFNQLFQDDPTTIDGIIFPSVKFGYQEFNIVLHPRAMQKLKFSYANQMWITHHSDHQQVQFTPLDRATADKSGNLQWNLFK